MKERGCQAPVHVDRCECQRCRGGDCDTCPKLTRDHFTPQCIARKILHWSKGKTNSSENTQWLSRACHREKDRTTQDRYFALKRKRITLSEVRDWASQSEYNKK